MRCLQVELGLLDLTLDLSGAMHHRLFSRPNLFEISKLPLYSINLLVQKCHLLNRRIGRVLLYRFALDFELDKAALQPIH